MKDLILESQNGTYITPAVRFIAESGVCEISGESFLEETAKFYAPIAEWLKNYTISENKTLIFSIKLTYFNTSTSKWILNILNILKDYEQDGNSLIVNWYYDQDDVDMQDDIEDYELDSGLKINKIKF